MSMSKGTTMKTQFGEKVVEAGYHINEMIDHATLWKEGDFVCKVIYEGGRYQLPCYHKYMIPDDIKILIKQYG